jgi:hypothetical protein
MPQASRHSEVDQESATGVEPNNQILAATLQRGNALAFELGGHRTRLEGADETRIVNLDSLERAANEVRLEREPDRLDLGQLGHQAIVSSTIGRGSGGVPVIS